MNLELINHFIEEFEKSNFIFSKAFKNKIANECESWKNDWVEVLKKLLRKIKNGQYPLTIDNKGRFRVTNPLVKNQYMAIFFSKQNNGNFFIDIIKIGINNI